MLEGRWIDRGIRIIAVSITGGETILVVICTLLTWWTIGSATIHPCLLAVLDAIGAGWWANAVLIQQAITIIVKTIAYLCCTWPYLCVRVITIASTGGEAIRILVHRIGYYPIAVVVIAIAIIHGARIETGIGIIAVAIASGVTVGIRIGTVGHTDAVLADHTRGAIRIDRTSGNTNTVGTGSALWTWQIASATIRIAEKVGLTPVHRVAVAVRIIGIAEEPADAIGAVR